MIFNRTPEWWAVQLGSLAILAAFIGAASTFIWSR